MSVQVPAWPFHISQREDKLSIQGEWHFIYSVASLSPGMHPQFLPFTALSSCPHWTAILQLILSYLHSLLPKLRFTWRYCTWDNRLSTVVRWGQGSGWSHLTLWFHSTGLSGYVMWAQLRIKRYISGSWGCEHIYGHPVQVVRSSSEQDIFWAAEETVFLTKSFSVWFYRLLNTTLH